MNAKNETITLEINDRPKTGKNAAYRLRKEKMIPGVLYGPTAKSGLPISVSYPDFRLAYNKAGKTSLITLQAKGDATKALDGKQVLIADMQMDPIKYEVKHIDLHELDLSNPIRVTVPVEYVGKAKGLEEGGVIDIKKRAIEIRVLPNKVPSKIEVDVSELGLNEVLHVTQVEKQLGKTDYEFMYEADFTLVGVVEPAEEIVTEAPAAEGAEGEAAAAPADGADAKAEGGEAKSEEKK
jgi:large subunit ribosomal protein L25